MADDRVLAVVVAYNPDAAGLASLLSALAPQVERVLVVDNSPREAPWRCSTEATNVVLHVLGENRGIAAAQNVGIAMALNQGFEHVVFSDQDSVPAPDMVAKLLDCHDELQRQGVAVGCVCPEYFDATTGQRFRFQVQRPGRLFYSSVAATADEPCLEIVTTISSGTLVPAVALERVGGMREDFFIDHVDTEWCHRARAAGFRNFGTARAQLTHALGDESFRVWYFGWRTHSEYSPTRLYYRFRNFILMCRLPHVPLPWAVRSGWYWLGNAYAHALFARHKAANVRAIVSGLWDGVRGVTGPLRRSL